MQAELPEPCSFARSTLQFRLLRMVIIMLQCEYIQVSHRPRRSQMNKEQTIQIHRKGTDYEVYRNCVLVRRVTDRGYAFRLAKQVFDATMKLATGPVFFDDFTSFQSEV